MSFSETAADMEKIIYNLTYISNMKTSEPKKMLFPYSNVAKSNKNTCLGKYLGLDCKCPTLNSYRPTLHVPGRLSMPQLKHF